ncbi:GAF domain-containing protein [Candidatus Methylospira mobilis]|uniref:GAF domain-containing protein n=1 Tax=Candidatus Methylospira mobilis TaxID=1808979 RepID=A0A5Q0BH41_9GAMM|nr:sigma 54-interacting transcriptional regulator [Candidatus Methylospira mobilis]QFY41521.1 GAF domain-containing protein [Candidatus Methylospira mobilis]WNV05243.1 sigma 54-interacting transcriptional regulator [Candidatus Methylospira mobilis]
MVLETNVVAKINSDDPLQLKIKPQQVPVSGIPHLCECDLGECRTNVLPLMYEMSRIVTESEDLAGTLAILLQVMKRHMKVIRGMVTLHQHDYGKIFIHKSFGLTDEEEARGIYFLGEGITGKVVETGKPIIVPRISDEPDFLNRTGSRNADIDRKLSFLCVPILRGGRVLGTISAERIYDNARLLRLDVEVLSILASTTAQAVELYLLENVHQVALENENLRLRNALKEKFKPSNIIGNSKPMQEVYNLIEKISKSKATVLILGESGVGKEVVASAIHYNSPSASGPFVKFNCAALPESVIESELFGHEKGSFTGAAGLRKGRFEEADGGTIFLDEAGELSLPMQAKLLRVLQEKTFERVGSNTPRKVDIRILAATNKDLAGMVANGSFREDLYYRLNVFPITIPPLRDRGNDIVVLADHFVEYYSKEMDIEIKRISTPALNMLLCYHWPGNVRELEHVIERAVILAEDGVIHGYHLPPSLQTPVISEVSCEGGLDAKLNTVEYEMIVEALKLHHGNTTEAAAHLGLTRRILGLRMNKYQLNYKEYR